jgi:transposase
VAPAAIQSLENALYMMYAPTSAMGNIVYQLSGIQLKPRFRWWAAPRRSPRPQLRIPLGSDTLSPASGLGKDVLVARSSKYPEQFRKDAVELVRTSDRPLRQVARDLGVNHETLRNSVKTAEKRAAQPSGGAATTDQDELRALRKRVAELEVAKEILRKAAAYFAKEMGR